MELVYKDADVFDIPFESRDLILFVKLLCFCFSSAKKEINN